MTLEWTNRVWETSRQRGDGLVLLLALSDCAGVDGQGRRPERDWLMARTRLAADPLDRTLRQVCDAGELLWGLGDGVGRDHFILTLGPSLRERARSAPWGAPRARAALPTAGGIVVARATGGEQRGLCHIARGKNPLRRFEQLRREYLEETDLLRAALIQTSDMDGALGYLAAVFRGHKLDAAGEWWYLTAEMLAWLGGLETLEQDRRPGSDTEEHA